MLHTAPNFIMACLLAPLIGSTSFVGACAKDAPPPATSPTFSSAPAAPSESPAPSASPTEGTEAPAPAAQSADAPAAPAASTASSESPSPPCIDGQILMGACICPDKGKGVDATGHCVYMPCPSEHGGETFRDPSTGECRECREGTRPTKDGRCER